MQSNKKIHEFLQKLDIKPNSIDIYVQSLTHKSYNFSNPSTPHYEMLEFLGDSAIHYAVTRAIYDNFYKNEGNSTQLRAVLTSTNYLAKVCQDLGLIELVFLGKGASEIRENNKLKADVFEAFSAAILLDQGFDKLNEFLAKYLYNGVNFACEKEYKDPKSIFQEKIQSFSSLSKINYLPTRLADGTFRVDLIWEEKKYGIGYGKSIKEAEFNAATNALNIFAVDTDQ
ncbi:ribonuclease III family protein [Mesomycoplasma ovipneumoniae]|uniref:ribonuclease III family protein n=1 Tax=Mesomycoplasma ovipneumoniae TaxID=29562 RepID=UPI000248CD61|nr:ribonuclease III domain-containing protein [Mesomycoplasma ovipneumoniae]MDW2834049.1 ribonuclease III domain-containing protein [Mesomycoplasma ovipneumoniae]WNM13833.1 ribonuclease III domain-containing protein [Mesomycoplasma ovipneumoniae]WNM13852.1 ribonuclease III domain-containing protein [Mesomycoplasma ovipneumoniae]